MHAVEVSPGRWLALSDSDDTPYGYHYYRLEGEFIGYKRTLCGVLVLLSLVLLWRWSRELQISVDTLKTSTLSSFGRVYRTVHGVVLSPVRSIPWTAVVGVLLLILGAVLGAMLFMMFIVYTLSPAAADRYADGVETVSTTLAAVQQYNATRAISPTTDSADTVVALRSTSGLSILPNLLLVTVGSASYFDRLQNLVGSLHVWEPNQRIVIYDMGLTPAQVSTASCWANVSLRRFDFARYPLHVRNLFNYAWKPLLFADAFQHIDSRAPGSTVLILDSGVEVRAPLGSVAELLRRHGYWVATQPNHVNRKTHPQTYARLGVAPRVVFGRSFCAGGLQGYVRDTYAYRHVLQPAIRCALDEDCIAPDGSGRSNHNYDQSVTSTLFYAHGLTCSTNRVFAEMDMTRPTLDPLLRNAVIMAGRRWHTPYPYTSLTVNRPLCTSSLPYDSGVDQYHQYDLIENHQSAHL
jgi:hypothetical protein